MFPLLYDILLLLLRADETLDPTTVVPSLGLMEEVTKYLPLSKAVQKKKVKHKYE